MKYLIGLLIVSSAFAAIFFWPPSGIEAKFMHIPHPKIYEDFSPLQKKFYDDLDIPTQKKIHRNPTRAEEWEDFRPLWEKHTQEIEHNQQ